MLDVKEKWTFLYMLKTLAALSFHFIIVSLGIREKACEDKETNVLNTNSDLICDDMT